MFDRYRAWLESELRLLGNASHHAYSIGQANMAKRALERFDETVREEAESRPAAIRVALTPDETRAAIDALESHGGADPAVVALRSRLVEALGRFGAGSEPEPSALFVELDPGTLPGAPEG